MIKIVAQANADTILDLVPEEDRRIALHRFIEIGSEGFMAEIIPNTVASDRSLLDRTDTHSQSLVIKAVSRQQRQAVQLLLGYSATINAQDNIGKTALHYAVEHDNAEMAKLLVRAGANLHIKDNFGRIPADWCSTQNHCLEIVRPKDIPIAPDSVGTTSARSTRNSWAITLGAKVGSCAWNIHGECDWYTDAIRKVLREDNYLISEAIPANIKLHIPQLHVIIEARDQGWSDDRWFHDRPVGSFTCESSFVLAILRKDRLILRREWAVNNSTLLRMYFAGSKPVSEDDQRDFVRRLTVGDRVVVLALSDGLGWMNIIKSAIVEIFFEGYN